MIMPVTLKTIWHFSTISNVYFIALVWHCRWAITISRKCRFRQFERQVLHTRMVSRLTVREKSFDKEPHISSLSRHRYKRHSSLLITRRLRLLGKVGMLSGKTNEQTDILASADWVVSMQKPTYSTHIWGSKTTHICSFLTELQLLRFAHLHKKSEQSRFSHELQQWFPTLNAFHQ